MNLTPPEIIGKKACLRVISLFGLSKYLRPKRHPNLLWNEELKEIKDFMKVEDGGVHHKRYNGCCMKQQFKIPKAT